MVNKTKSIIKILLIFILMILITTTVKAVKLEYFGDLVEDGKLDSNDYIYFLTLTKSKNGFPKRQKTIADINMDGKITSSDLTKLKNIIQGNEPKKAIVLLGDVNYDLKVDSEDSRLILQYATKVKTPKNNVRFLADIDGNGKIDSADSRLALRMATSQEKLKYVERGYTLKYIGNNNTVKVYGKVNGKETTKRFLKKNEIVVIQEIDSDFLNKDILKINRNEYIKDFKAAYFKKATEAETLGKVFGNGKYEINGTVYTIGNGKANENGEIFIDSTGRAFNMYKQTSTEFGNLKYEKYEFDEDTKQYILKETTIRESGCLPTSYSIILSGYGFTDNPQETVNKCANPRNYFERNGFTFKNYVSDLDYKNDSELYKIIESKLEEGYKIVIGTAGAYDENKNLIETKIAGESLFICEHSYTILDIRNNNGKIEVFYSDPDAGGNIKPTHGWYSIYGFTNIYYMSCIKKL